MSKEKSAATVAFEEGRRLADDPNICGVGHGAKLRGGVPVSAGCLVFLVRRKLPTQAIAATGSWPIPPQVSGLATDVVEVGDLRAAAADRALPSGNRGTRVAEPLVGGVATMGLGATVPGPGGYGTLGGLAFDTATSTPLVLSNAHVWGQAGGTEIANPIMAAAVLGASATPATIGQPPSLVLSRIPPGLTAPVVFASSIAQSYLATGGSGDPFPVGQAATPVPPTNLTTSEQVTVSAPGPGLPPAGRRLSPSVTWDYRRLSPGSVLSSQTIGTRTQNLLLAARRLFTNAASYTAGQTVNLYAEIIPAAGGGPTNVSAHFPVVLLYPLPAGDKLVPRVLRSTARQTPATVTTSFQGFPAPARLGSAVLPVSVGAFTIDGDVPGTFKTPPAGTLPAGTLVLALPAGTVRLFAPPSTRVVIDVDLHGIPGPLQVSALNSAGDLVGTSSSNAGTGTRTNLTVDASEIVEVRLANVSTAQVFGVTSTRSSPETTAPLSYAGTASATDLGNIAKGQWGASLFVQALDSGAPESANVVEMAAGLPTLISDCLFTVS